MVGRYRKKVTGITYHRFQLKTDTAGLKLYRKCPKKFRHHPSIYYIVFTPLIDDWKMLFSWSARWKVFVAFGHDGSRLFSSSANGNTLEELELGRRWATVRLKTTCGSMWQVLYFLTYRKNTYRSSLIDLNVRWLIRSLSICWCGDNWIAYAEWKDNKGVDTSAGPWYAELK